MLKQFCVRQKKNLLSKDERSKMYRFSPGRMDLYQGLRPLILTLMKLKINRCIS